MLQVSLVDTIQETSGSLNRAALEYDINTWKHQLPNCEDTLTIALLTAVVHVATELLQDRALLLPQVRDVFLSKYGTVRNSSQLYLEVGDSEVQFSSRWLLHQLIVYLHSYMRYKCIHKKFGIILYRNGGDLLQSLSWALGSKCQTHSSENSFEPLKTELQTSKLHRGEQKVIKQAATIINNLILEEVRRLAGKDKETDLKRLNIDSLISEINPLLWEFVTSITRPAYQQKSSSSETESTAHIKKVRRFNIICLLMYWTNLQCPTALHMLLADTVETCGSRLTAAYSHPEPPWSHSFS